MRIKILVFGIVKEMIGDNNLSLEIDGPATVKKLKNILVLKYPQLKRVSNFVIAINQQYATDNKKIKQGDEIAIIPPTNGG